MGKTTLIGQSFMVGPRKVIKISNSVGVVLGTKFKALYGHYVIIKVKVIKLPPQQEGGGS